MRRNVNYRKLEKILIGSTTKDKSKICRPQCGKNLSKAQFHGLERNYEIKLKHPTYRFINIYIKGDSIAIIDTLRLCRLHIITDDYAKVFYENKTLSVHRLVLEAKLGRELMDGEQTHHLNRNKLDNRPNNLIAVDNNTHKLIHKILKEIEK